MKHTYYVRISPLRLAVLDLCQQDLGSDVWDVTRVNVPPDCRRKGYASRLLREACEDADLEGVTLRLAIYGTGDMSDEDLAHWYARYGFVRDPDGGELDMIREPESEGE